MNLSTLSFGFPPMLPSDTDEAWLPRLENDEMALLSRLEQQRRDELTAIREFAAPKPLGVRPTPPGRLGAGGNAVGGAGGDDDDEEEDEEEEEDGNSDGDEAGAVHDGDEDDEIELEDAEAEVAHMLPPGAGAEDDQLLFSDGSSGSAEF